MDRLDDGATFSLAQWCHDKLALTDTLCTPKAGLSDVSKRSVVG